MDSLAKSIILSSKGEDGVKLKEKYFDMCRKQALKILEEQGTKIRFDPEDTMIEIINRTQYRILRVISLADIITEHLWFSDRLFLSQQITADIFLDGFNGTPDIKAFFRKYL